jgi:hypothetical protein
MHTSGPGPTSAILPFLTPTSPVQRPAATAPPVALTGPSAAPPSSVPAQPPAQTATVSAAPPPGTDPELWSVLTPEEQQFFNQMAALGPLTYGTRQGQSAPEALVGQRVDIRG